MSELPTARAMQLRLQFKEQWPIGKARQDKVKNYILANVPGVEVKEIGFGSNTTEMLYTRNPNPGDPDLEVTYNGRIVALVEVTGGRQAWPKNVLLRTDKVRHAKRETPFEDIWYCHVSGEEYENVFCHNLKTALRHEFEVATIMRENMPVMRAVTIPATECVPLVAVAEWMNWKVDFIKKVYGA